jgi:uncharacterized membrane protein YhaH (DUF805 family)
MLSCYLAVLKKYAVFKGRAPRKEYWTFTLINIALLVCLAGIEQLTGVPGFSLILALALFLPALGVTIRRFHDINRSGWWILISLVPIIGSIVILIFALLESTPGDNRFGPLPA